MTPHLHRLCQTKSGYREAFHAINNGSVLAFAPVLLSLGIPSKTARQEKRSTCVHLGDVVEYAHCGSATKHVYACNFEGHDFDRCTLIPNSRDDVESCTSCRYRQTKAPVVTIGEPSKPLLRYDESNLFPSLPKKRFNPSIIQWKDGYAFVWRDGWKGSEIWACRMNRELAPISEPVRLVLNHGEANYGREDPRLFIFRGQLHLSYTGVVGGRRIRHTNVLYARLSDEFRVEQVYFPKVPKRNLWEKNHSYFEHAGQLYAVYAIAPHKILRIDGESVEWAYETPTQAPWSLKTEMRGGASPVLVGNEFWSFFHSRIVHQGLRVYCTGLYTFDAKPPFAVRRIIPEPIQWADVSTKPADQYAAVTFVGGAVRDGDRWILASGVHDRWIEFHAFDHAELESRLVNVG